MGRLRRILRLAVRHRELERGLVINEFRALFLDDFDAGIAEAEMRTSLREISDEISFLNRGSR
jgi:hypothetical protein